MDLSKLPPKALAAAMKGGTAGWGQVASAADHVRYSQPVRPASRRRCPCGCGARATHMGMANGMALASGCAMAIARWVKTGRTVTGPLKGVVVGRHGNEGTKGNGP